MSACAHHRVTIDVYGPSSTILVTASLKVEAIGENHDVECYVLSDRSLWSVETGAPLTRLWNGHRLRDLPESVIVNRLPDMLRRLIEDADHDTLAKTYAAMLETIR